MLNFQQINQCLKHKEYPLLTTDKVMQDVSGFALTSVIDVNMGYILIPFCAELRRILIIDPQY